MEDGRWGEGEEEDGGGGGGEGWTDDDGNLVRRDSLDATDDRSYAKSSEQFAARSTVGLRRSYISQLCAPCREARSQEKEGGVASKRGGGLSGGKSHNSWSLADGLGGVAPLCVGIDGIERMRRVPSRLFVGEQREKKRCSRRGVETDLGAALPSIAHTERPVRRGGKPIGYKRYTRHLNRQPGERVFANCRPSRRVRSAALRDPTTATESTRRKWRGWRGTPRSSASPSTR